MIQVTLYSREDCHLCHQAQADLDALQSEFPHLLVVVDIDNSPALQRQYGFEVPVVEIGPLILKAPISRDELRQALAANAKRETQPKPQMEVAGGAVYQTGSTWTRADSFTYWFSRHYLAVLNTLVGLFIFLPILAPVLLQAGFPAPAGLIYKAYGATCHQLAFRSFFLFGEQAVYPRAAAGIDGIISFNQASGLSEESDPTALFQARSFTGTPQMGYKIAICERDIALYGSIFLFGLLYALNGRRLKPLPWYLWVIFGLLPIAIDGLSQLFSQPPFNFIPLRESTPLFRTLTGALFGFLTAWFGYPAIDQTMRDTQAMMEAKQQKAQAAQRAKQAAEPAD